MTTRAELLDHLDRLTDAGHPPPCWRVPVAERTPWTSDVPAEQALAARTCRGCPALAACAEYGREHPREVGVYGGRTEWDRRRTTTTTEDDR